MSWVFLAGDQVFKLKKPVRSPVLDFSTLAAREHYGREELRLNARLAPGVYRGLVALLCRDDQPALRPESQRVDRRQVVDWLVWMNRLPAERMLDRAIAAASVRPADIDALAQVLTAFYRAAAPVALAPDDPLMLMRHELEIDRQVLLRPPFQIDGAPQALDQLEQALHRHAAALRQRAAGGCFVDGHGDLRPEHVCLLAPPVVIDCLEFNARLRQVDPWDELAFLGLECELAGAPWIGPRLAQACAAALGPPPPGLLPLYTASRALLRARLSLAHLLDAQPRTPARWRPQTRRYVACARAALARLQGPDIGP